MNLKARDKYRKLPISDDLLNFMDAHPDFEESLKLSNTDRFVCLNHFILSQQPPSTTHHQDQVVAMWYADKWNIRSGIQPFFKQDFVVNLGMRNQEFVSYTSKRSHPPYVYSLSAFFAKYGDGDKYYHRQGSKPWVHHYNDISDLPEDDHLRAEAESIKTEVLAEANSLYVFS
jgi:hypothetical protein